MTNSTNRVEIITSVQRRRRWMAPEKVRMVEETLENRGRGNRRLPLQSCGPSPGTVQEADRSAKYLGPKTPQSIGLSYTLLNY